MHGDFQSFVVQWSAKMTRCRPQLKPLMYRVCGLQLEPFTKYLRLTLVSMSNNALREKFNFCFSRVFC